MVVTCMNPEHVEHNAGGIVKHEIPPGVRRIDINPLAINWGDTDVREDWQSQYTFCSFACLAAWATARAGDHDEHVLVHGATPEGDGT